MLIPATLLTPAELAKAIVHPLTIAPTASVIDVIALMNTDSHTCDFSCELDTAADLPLSGQRSCVLVMEQGNLLGIVTEGDLVRLSVEGCDFAKVAIADVMSSSVITLPSTNFTDIFIPLSLFQHYPIRHLPLVDHQGRVVGLLTYDSLRQLLPAFDLLHLLTTTDVMIQDVIQLEPTATLVAVSELISSHHVSSVVIVEHHAHHTIPAGIITEKDIVQLLSIGADLAKITAQTIMSTPVVCVNSDTSLWVTQQLMQERQIDQIVVTCDQGNLLGLVTQTSLLNLLNPITIYGLVERLVQERTSQMQQQMAREKLLTQIATQIRAALNLSDVLDATVVAAREFLQCDRLLVYQFPGDGRGIVVAESVGEGWRALLHEIILDPCFVKDVATPYQHGKTLLINNIHHCGYPECLLNLLCQYQVKAKLVVPILVQGQLWGLLIAHQCDRYRQWQPTDLTLLDEIAVELAIAIQQATTYQKMQTELVEHQRTAAALRASEERFRQIIETTLEGVWIIDTDDRTSYVNPRLAAMLGYTIDEMLGKKLFDFMEETAQAHTYLERRRLGIEEQHDFRFQTKTGQDVWTLISTNPLYDDQGNYIGALAMVTDISDRQATESMLRKYERVVATTTDGIALLDRNYVYQLVNHVYRDFLNQPPTVIVGQSMPSILGETVFATFFQPFLELCLLGEIQQSEAWFKYHNGDRRFIRVTYSPYTELDGSITGVVISTHDLTAIKQAEEALEQLNQKLEHRVEERTAALQASEERWMLALRGANDGIWDWNLQTNQIFFSTRWKEMRGFSEDEIGDSPNECLSRIHPDDYDYVMAAVADHFAGKTEFFEIEYRTQRRDGSYMWVLDRAQALRDESGQTIRMSGSESDITQRKLAEAALRESERRYASLAAAAPVAIFRFDQPLNCVYVNDRWSKMTGRPKESALGQGWMAALHPDDTEQCLTNWSTVLVQNSEDLILNCAEGRHLLPDGSVNWFYVQVVTEKDTTGEVIGYVGTLTDITARKQAEQENQQLKERLQFVLSTSPAVIFTCKPESDYAPTFVSDNIYNVTGYTTTEFLSQPSFWVDHIHPEDISPLFTELSQLFEQGYHIHEYRFRHQAGHYLWIRNELRLICNQQGKPLEIVGYFADISDRKQAELALEQEMLRRITVFNTSSDGIHILDIKGNIIEANASFAQMLGYTLEEVASLNVADWDAQWSAPELQEIITNQVFNNRTFETLHRRQDGSVFPVEISERSMEWNGELALVCIARDISERKQAELALQESQRFIQQIADSSPNILYLYDIQTQRNVYVNREIASILGYTPEAVQAMGSDLFPTVLHPDDLKRLPERYERIKTAQDGAILESEYRMRHINGEWRWLYSRDVVFSRDHQGRVKQIIGTAQDISDRKCLEQAQNRLIAILEASTDYILISDLKGTAIWNNTALKQLRGLESDLVVCQQTPSDYHPSSAVELLTQHAVPIARVQGSWLGENILLDAQGQEIPVSQLLLAHKSPQGEIEFFSTIMRDMRVHKQYEQQLERTNAELLRATRLKDEFLANMSHELRTPLNAILGMSESLLDGLLGVINDRQQQAIATIERSGQHLLGLINDILELSKIEAGKLELSLTSVDISQLCRSSLSFVRQQALKKQIQLNLSLTPNQETIAVDERRIRQVLINLLTNAIKFTPIGGRVTLELHCEPMEVNLAERVSIISSHRGHHPPTPHNCPPGCGYYLCISVIDTGIGIAPADQAKLFQPFVQIDSRLNRKYEGTGLGLALVKRIAELHGGDVSLRSELGQGSCFTVRLPYICQIDARVPPSTNTQSQPIAPVEVMTAPIPIPSPVILLAEDNEANISTISSYLEAKGYQVIVAKTGQEAINLTETHRPDLILMDIQMPGLDGLQAIEKIRQVHPLTAIPIIALTALAMNGDREKCLTSGANDYLAKPVKLKQLSDKIQQLLSK